MTLIGLWHIEDDGPRKLEKASVSLERYLEDWIEHDPSLLQNGLTIVGRQLRVEGGQLDLLALDPQGQWVVIEIKAGAVRRETIAQALDYASSIAVMPFDELEKRVDDYLCSRTEGHTTLRALLDVREDDGDPSVEDRDVLIFVVGTGRVPGLERMVDRSWRENYTILKRCHPTGLAGRAQPSRASAHEPNGQESGLTSGPSWKQLVSSTSTPAPI